MVRDEPLSPPDPPAIRVAAEATVGGQVTDVAPIEPGLNAVYRVAFADGRRAVCKVATLSEPGELLAEPILLRAVHRETAVPVPAVLGVAPTGAGSLAVPHFHQELCEGRTDATVLVLAPAERERLVGEAGRHLAALHDLVPDALPGLESGTAFGRLRGCDDELYADPAYDSWGETFGAIVADTVEGLRGEGYTVDGGERFADLAGPIEATLGGPPAAVAAWAGDPSLVLDDYRPANLVVAPRDEGPPVTRAVLDFGGCRVGDGLYDLARAEGALVDVPLGGTDAAERLRSRLRERYAADRPDTPSFGRRYEAYRAVSMARRLASLGYWARFAREDDVDATAERLRSFVTARLAAVE